MKKKTAPVVAVDPAHLPPNLAKDMAAVSKWGNDLTVVGDNGQWTYDVLEQVGYDARNLSPAMEDHPGLVAWWGSVAARLSRLLGEAELKVKKVRADVARNYRATQASRGFKYTEATVGEEVDSNVAVIAGQMEVLKIEERIAQVKAILEALRHRKDLLLEEGARQRQEYRNLNLTTHS